MNQKLGLILLIIFGLFLAALISRNAALAWMTLPFLCYLAAGVLSAPQQIQLQASRKATHLRCEAGTPITMTVVVENVGQSLPFIRLHETLEPNLRLLGTLHETSGPLRSGKKATLEYSFQAPRGRYRWETIQVTASDPFGLFEKSLEIAADLDILVLPGRMSTKPEWLKPRHTLHAPGLYPSRQAGPGINFFGVREYHPGDPLRWVYWRLSARHPDQLFSKEFEREEMADIGLILDGSSGSNLKNGTEELFEVSVQAAAVLARYILREGNRLSMLALGERVVRVFPGAGKHQLACILDQLAACQPGETVSLETMKYLPVKLFPSHALLILISPLRASDFPAIARLLAHGYQVLVVSPDPVEFISQESPKTAAVHAAALERAALLWRIRKMGAQVLDWPFTLRPTSGDDETFSYAAMENEDEIRSPAGPENP